MAHSETFEQQRKKVEERCLLQEHIDYLTDKNNLARWHSWSLVDRCHNFERVFPGKKLSASRLSQIYRSHRVKKRKLQKQYVLTQTTLERRHRQRLKVFELVLKLMDEALGTLLWADEATFVSNEFRELRVYSLPGP